MRSKSYEYRKTNTSCNLERIEYRATEAKAKGNTPIRSNLLLSGYRSAACLYSSGCLHGRSTSAAGRPIEPAPCGQAKAQGERQAAGGRPPASQGELKSSGRRPTPNEVKDQREGGR
jgi:hypothetical protein